MGPRRGRSRMETVKKLGRLGFLGVSLPGGRRRRRRGHADERARRRGRHALRRVVRPHGREPRRARLRAHQPVRRATRSGSATCRSSRPASGSARGASPSRARAATPAALRTRAVRDGDHWVINGTKMFITQGTVGAVYVVLALDGAGQGHRRHHGVRRRARHAGVSQRPEDREARAPLERHRRARARERPRSGRAA